MKGSYVVLQIELDAIRNFLEHVDREAGVEIQNILERNDAGEFQEDLDDLENALYGPVMRQEIAARAVYCELNALVERELQCCAYRAWLASTKHRGPKSLDFANLTLDSVRSLKMVQDLRFGPIVRLIEEKYQIRVEDLDGGGTFLKTREMVNAFKHRNGLVDFRKEVSTRINFMEHHKADIEQAYEAINNAHVFIEALWKATDREPAPPITDQE